MITLADAWVAYAILPIYVSLEKIARSLRGPQFHRRTSGMLPSIQPTCSQFSVVAGID
jgi:hypothetical protein